MSLFIEAPTVAPYQGCSGRWVQNKSFFKTTKSFGSFKCNYCNSTWISAHARKSFKQGCKSCKREFLPAYMWENDTVDYDRKQKTLEDNGKPHMSQLCEACRKGFCERMTSNLDSITRLLKTTSYRKPRYVKFW